MAGEWIISPTATLEETFTDNVRSSGDDRESDYITSTIAGLNVSGTGARVQLNFNYRISRDTYLETSDLDSTRQSFTGISNVELWEDNVFFDARGALSQRSINRGGQESATDRDLGTNQTQVLTYSVGPSFRRRYAGWAESDIRYRLNGSMFLETDVGEQQGNAAATQPRDTYSHEFTTALRSGPRFSRLFWELSSVDSIRYRGDDDESTKRRTSRLFSEYSINRFVSARSSVGYEKIETADFAEDTSGMTWSVGSRVKPGPRTEFVVDWGQRFQSTTMSASASYDLGPAALFRFTYSENIETEQEILDRNLRNLIRDPLTGDLIDPLTGLPADPNATDFDLIDQTSRTQTTTLAVRGGFLKTYQYSAQVNLVSREFDSANAGDVNGDEQVATYSLTLSHTLRPGTTLSTRARYSDTIESTTETGGRQTVSAGISLSHEFARDLFGVVRYDFRHQEPDNRDSVTENSATVRLQKQF